MIDKILILLAWLYWQVNKPFVAAFAEAILGYGEGGFKVEGRAVVRKLDHFLHEINPPVFLQFVGTLIVLPLYEPPSLPKSDFARALSKAWYGFRSFFGHGQFLVASKQKRAAWIEKMYRRLIEQAPEQEDYKIKTIVTLSLFKSTLGIAYLDEHRLWEAMSYVPFQKRPWDPPTGADLKEPPSTPDSRMLHEKRMSPGQITRNGHLTYCVIGSGAGGAVAAQTIQQRHPEARVILLDAGSLVTHDQFKTTVMDSIAELYMNGALTLSSDQQFMFQQGRCVGGSTVINNSVALKPVGFWWDDLKARWQGAGAQLDYDDFYKQYDTLEQYLSVSTLNGQVITQAASTFRDGIRDLIQQGAFPSGYIQEPLVVPSNSVRCIGCGRCNLGCQYDAKQSLLVTLIPEFVANGGLLVPDASARNLEFRTDASNKDDPYSISAVYVSDGKKTFRIEADRFILASGTYASTKLLWRSGFLGATPGVRTVGKRFSVNAGSPVGGIFPERQNAFLGQQVGYLVEVPKERMVIETAFAPPGIVSLGLPAWGPEFQRRLQKINYTITATPVLGTIAYGEIKRGFSGDSGFVIDFKLAPEDWRRMERGMQIIAKAMFSQGATEVYINRFDARSVRRAEDINGYFGGIGPSDFITVLSAHLQGGNVMAAEPYYGVVDENLKVYGIKNLWICDASVIPAPITINIAMTVMALSRYASLRITEA